MKLSVSLPDDDVAFLDSYAVEHGMTSRSAAVQAAVGTLRAKALVAAYAEAFEEWDASGDADLWDLSVGDGIE